MGVRLKPGQAVVKLRGIEVKLSQGKCWRPAARLA